MIVGPALARGYKLLPDFSYEPWIFDKDCTVVAESPFTVDCTIRPEAKWSDGVPITPNDFKFTYDTIMNAKNDVVTRNGYDKITAFNVLSPTEFQMVFQEVFAPYRELWAGASTTVLPQHVLEGKNFNKVWNTCICDPKTKKPISSGPMMVQSFTPDRAGHARARTRTTGAARWHRCRRSCSSRAATPTPSSTPSAPVRST